jgi:creatinine amidohydrolase
MRRWASLTSTEAAAAASRDPVVVLPLAATEQHGPHLPLCTDLDIGMGLLAEALDRLPADAAVWSLPALSVGASREHARFAGTLSLDVESLVGTIRGVGSSLARTGVRRLVVSNSHGGNRSAMDAAGLWLRHECGMLVVKVSYADLERPDGVDLPESEWKHGLHGGAVETAMMLHLHADRVRSDGVRRFDSLGVELDDELRRMAPEGGVSFSWLAGDLNPDGVVGDPTLATAEMGRRLVEHYGGALADVFLDALEFPLERLG